jgi:hypothetical protein
LRRGGRQADPIRGLEPIPRPLGDDHHHPGDFGPSSVMMWKVVAPSTTGTISSPFSGLSGPWSRQG